MEKKPSDIQSGNLMSAFQNQMISSKSKLSLFCLPGIGHIHLKINDLFNSGPEFSCIFPCPVFMCASVCVNTCSGQEFNCTFPSMFICVSVCVDRCSGQVFNCIFPKQIPGMDEWRV